MKSTNLFSKVWHVGLFLLFAVSLLLSLTACGGSNASAASASNTAASGQPAPADWTVKVSVNQIGAGTNDWKTTVSVFAKNFAQGTDAKLVWDDGFEAKVKIGVESLPFDGHPVTEATLMVGNKTFDFKDDNVIVESKGASNPLDVFILVP